jgi:[acyl-carrier-protein] S-malonyltransferase
LRTTLAEAEFQPPSTTVVAATDGVPYSDPDEIRDRLARQVFGPVQWVNTVNAMIDMGASSFIECGPGKVLAGLCRRISKSTPVAFIDSNDSLQKALQI